MLSDMRTNCAAYLEHLVRVEQRCLDIAIEVLLAHMGILHDGLGVVCAKREDEFLVQESNVMERFLVASPSTGASV